MATSAQLKCHICGLGVEDGVTVYRQNRKGQPGIWACQTHNMHRVNPDVKAIVDAVEDRDAD